MAEESLGAILAARLKKRSELIATGVDPYPARTGRKETVAEARKLKGKTVTVAGRLRGLRLHGAITFGDLEDASGKIQLLIKDGADLLHPRGVKTHLGGVPGRLSNVLDIGDFVEAKGKVITTKAGEVTVEATELTILTKSLRPLPSTWHGLKDVEERYRRRYVDLLINSEVRQTFETRTKIIAAIRESLEAEGFIEVETPVLQNIAAGTLARPFTTHYHAYDTDVFLRIAPELYLKRLIVGGFEKVYEFARCFRNEGVDATHNPEFTNLEFYWAYADFEAMMALTEAVIRDAAAVVGRKLPKEFQRQRYLEFTEGSRSDEAFKERVKQTAGPLFITHHPVELSPLAKMTIDDPTAVERFQLILGELEIANAWSEINDPVDQRERFEAQAEQRQKGDEEAHPYDEDFVEALEHGMPPTAGCGIGIDRLVMLLTGKKALREILLFPYMKPKNR